MRRVVVFEPDRPWTTGSAMPKAWDAIRGAARAANVLSAAINIGTIEEAWNQFLVAVDTAWNQAGAVRKTGSSLQWWNKQKKLKRDDGLLRYVHQAKDNQSHSPEPSIARHPGLQSIMIRAASPGGVVRVNKIAPGLDGSPFGPGGTFDVAEGMTTVMNIVPTIKPLPVVNRGVTFDVPTTHLGIKLPGQDFAHLAQAAYAWHFNVLLELETRLNDGKKPRWMELSDQFNQAWRESLERVKKEQAAKQQKPSE